MGELKIIWRRLQSWQGAVWLPILPPLSAVLELVVLIALIVAAEAFVPGLDVAALEPSPYWIPVLLLSLQYGTVAGVLAAAAATVAYAVNGLPEQLIGENLFAYYLRIWALPMLWVAVALLLGQFRLRQLEKKQDLKRRLAQRTTEAATLANYTTELEARCQALERQASVRAGAAGLPALDALARLRDPNVDLSRGLAAVVDSALPGASLSLYEVTASGLERMAGSSANAAPGAVELIPSAHPLYRALMAERRTVNALDSGAEAVLRGEGLAAVPVTAVDGRAIGALKLDVADPAQLTAALPRVLALIAATVSSRLADAREGASGDGEARGAVVPLARRRQHWRDSPTAGDDVAREIAELAADRTPRPKLLN